MMSMMRAFSILFSILLAIPVVLTTAACTSGAKNMQEGTIAAEGTLPEVGAEYRKVIESYSAGDTEYSGFYNNFEFKTTLHNTRVWDALLAKQAEYYLWTREKLMSEREEANRSMNQVTSIFLSFFTPDRRNDNLTDSKSIWRVFLDVNGRRYEGTVKKSKRLLAELQVLYPYHTRWNTPYVVEFPVPTTALETQTSKVTITGPLGTREVTIPGI